MALIVIEKIGLVEIPDGLEEAIRYLNETVTSKDDLKILHESTFILKCHQTMGDVLKSKWRLWDPHSPLHVWFHEYLELFNADDIVTVILIAWHRDMNEKEWDLVELAKQKLAYWETVEIMDEAEAISYITAQLPLRLKNRGDISFDDFIKMIKVLYYLVFDYKADGWEQVAKTVYNWEKEYRPMDTKQNIDEVLNSLIQDIYEV
jgi:hypothetical protein